MVHACLDEARTRLDLATILDRYETAYPDDGKATQLMLTVGRISENAIHKASMTIDDCKTTIAHIDGDQCLL